MAFPVIQYATTGSNTAASGAGPATAVTGTNAAHNSGGGTTITFTNSPDLSGVASDGSHALFLDTSSGNRKLYRITAVDDGADTVTVAETPPAISAGGGEVSYAIGGIRADQTYDSSRPDWDDLGWGWVCEFDAGTYTMSSGNNFDPGTAAGSSAYTDGPIIYRAKSGAASRPVIVQNQNVQLLYAGQNGTLIFEGLKLQVGTSGGANSYITGNFSAALNMVDCVIDINSKASYAFYVTGRGQYNIIDCYVTGATARQASLGGSDCHFRMVGCTIENSTASGDAIYVGETPNTFTVEIINCLITGDGASGDGIRLGMGNHSNCMVQGCTIADNNGDGIELLVSTTSVSYTAAVFNNVICDNGGYGINGNLPSAPGNARCWVDFNAYRNNTSGNITGISAGANDVTLTADPFTGATDYTLNSTAGGGTACKGAGFPGVFPDGT